MSFCWKPRKPIRKEPDMSREEIHKLDNIDLLKLFTEYILKYNPQDEAIVEGYQMIVEEVLSRMTDVV